MSHFERGSTPTHDLPYVFADDQSSVLLAHSMTRSGTLHNSRSTPITRDKDCIRVVFNQGLGIGGALWSGAACGGAEERAYRTVLLL